MINKIIRNYIAKRMAGRSDDGIMITLKDPQRVTLGENIMADLLMRNGINPVEITSEAQLKTILQQIENAEAAAIRNTGIRNAESAKVFDLEGKEIPKGSKIMGGKAVDDDLPPPGSRGGPDDIAAPVMNVEDAPPGFIDFVRKTDPEGADKLQKVEDEIKAAIEAGNKRAAENLRKKKKKKDDDPEKKAEGGIMRLGLKEGSGMTRRTFLKFLAGAASIPIIGKIFKPLKVGKTVSKVPIIKTADVAGKPEWFDQLVNKVILEGDEVTKRFATKDREIVHMKKIDDDNTVMVYQDLDEGAVRIDYDAPTNMGEDTVSLEYKKPLPDEGAPNPKAEFQATETEPRYVGGPEDTDIEFDAVGGGSDIRMIESDVSKLKEYATGKGPTMKEFIQSKKRKDAVKAINEDQLEQAEYIAGKYGDGPEPPDDIDFASGGIARMLGE
jgi:hypothetical protein